MKKNQFNKLNFLIFLVLSLVIVVESIFIISKLEMLEKLKETVTPIVGKIIPKPKEGKLFISLNENQTVKTGKDLKAQIWGDSKEESIAGVDIILVYDPNLITIKEINANEDLFNQIIINKKEANSGRLKVTAYLPKKEIRGENILGFLTFRLLKNKANEIKIEFTGPYQSEDSNLVSQNTQKDILTAVESLNIIPE